MSVDTIAAAALALTDTWDEYTLYDLGPKLTCTEVEALAELFKACGHVESADTLMASHAEDDDAGDLHGPCPKCETATDQGGYCTDAGCENVGKVPERS